MNLSIQIPQDNPLDLKDQKIIGRYFLSADKVCFTVENGEIYMYEPKEELKLAEDES